MGRWKYSTLHLCVEDSKRKGGQQRGREILFYMSLKKSCGTDLGRYTCCRLFKVKSITSSLLAGELLLEQKLTWVEKSETFLRWLLKHSKKSISMKNKEHQKKRTNPPSSALSALIEMCILGPNMQQSSTSSYQAAHMETWILARAEPRTVDPEN